AGAARGHPARDRRTAAEAQGRRDNPRGKHPGAAQHARLRPRAGGSRPRRTHPAPSAAPGGSGGRPRRSPATEDRRLNAWLPTAQPAPPRGTRRRPPDRGGAMSQPACTMVVRVVPRAKKTEISGERDGALVVRVAAPPVEGAANDALVEFLAKRLGVPKRAVQIVGGERGRLKRVAIAGVTDAQVRALFPLG